MLFWLVLNIFFTVKKVVFVLSVIFTGICLSWILEWELGRLGDTMIFKDLSKGGRLGDIEFRWGGTGLNILFVGEIFGLGGKSVLLEFNLTNPIDVLLF